MIKPLAKKANLFILLGLTLSLVGQFGSYTEDTAIYGLLLWLIGTVIFVVGASYYARAKGRSPWWGAAGLFGLLGLIVLVVLKDFHKASIPSPDVFD